MAATYLVTGAGRGLGLELARQLSGRGVEVIATAREPASARALAGLKVRIEQLDVGDARSVNALRARLGDQPLDVLINNAGIGGHGQDLESLDMDEIARFFQINSLGALRVAQALLPCIENGSRKLVVNITSRMGSIDDNAMGGAYGYRASKAALNMFTRSMAIDLAPRGITCVVLHPGWVQTDMGGPRAPMSVERSVTQMLAVIDRLGASDSGRFYDFAGNLVPW